MNEFRTFTLPTESNPFEALRASVRFEDLGAGRQGTVLIQSDATGSVPLVRTTTRYRFPAQPFAPIHEQLAEQIRQRAALPVAPNNALLEVYTNAYTTMGSHSDQALDLADESCIALFSCYEHPERANPPRKLIVEGKETGARHVLALTPNSVVVFSLDANRRSKHKIVLGSARQVPANQWLGITFRTSKTLVQYRDGGVYFHDGTRLALASESQRKEFYSLRHRENNETAFVYPRLTYTISPSDLMPPEKLVLSPSS